MKNRGYAMSAIVYPILLICLILVVSLLFNYQSKQTLLEQLKSEVQDIYNVNSGILWKTWLLKANSNYNNYETLEEALSDTDNNTAANVFNSAEATSYLKQNPVLVGFIKELSNYETELVAIILASTTLSNEEKYEVGLPCYISNASTIYEAVGNGYSMDAKVEPLYSTNSLCTALYTQTDGVGFRLTSNCKGTIPYVYSKNYIDLTDYDSAHIYLEYYRNCPTKTYTVTTNFGFTKIRGLADNTFANNYIFTFDNASEDYDPDGENHKYLDYDLDIASLSGNYYYKHYVVHNGDYNYCSGYNIIRDLYLY